MQEPEVLPFQHLRNQPDICCTSLRRAAGCRNPRSSFNSACTVSLTQTWRTYLRLAVGTRGHPLAAPVWSATHCVARRHCAQSCARSWDIVASRSRYSQNLKKCTDFCFRNLLPTQRALCKKYALSTDAIFRLSRLYEYLFPSLHTYIGTVKPT